MELISIAGLLPDAVNVLGSGKTALWDSKVKCYKVTQKGPWYLLYRSNYPGSSRKHGGLRCEMRITNQIKAIQAFDQKMDAIHAYALVNARCEIVCIQAKYTTAFANNENIKGAVRKWKTDNGKK